MATSAEHGARAASGTPDRVRLNQIQASRLSQLTNIDIREIEGRDTLQLSESLKWRIEDIPQTKDFVLTPCLRKSSQHSRLTVSPSLMVK